MASFFCVEIVVCKSHFAVKKLCKNLRKFTVSHEVIFRDAESHISRGVGSHAVYAANEITCVQFVCLHNQGS